MQYTKFICKISQKQYVLLRILIGSQQYLNKQAVINKYYINQYSIFIV